jgi:hypothetical protein
MPTVIDSLFLELGVDVSKFSVDQRRALQKIAEFERAAKLSAGKATGSINQIGTAFRDLGKIAGGAGSPLGLMTKGLGMLLSPTTLGIAAVGMLAKEMWDLNKVMTANDAVMARQAQYERR